MKPNIPAIDEFAVPPHNPFQTSVEQMKFLEFLPLAVYTCNKAGAITFFNKMAVKLWGYTPDISSDDVKFCACHKVWLNNGTFVLPHQTPMAITLQTGQSFTNLEALVERPDGTRFYACVNINPILDEKNKVVGAINVFTDITAQKQLEVALKESEQRYKALFFNTDTPLYTTDEEGIITLYNKAATNLWGREPEIGKDRWCGWWKIYKPDGSELPMEECPMAIALKEQRPIFGEEILVERPDGSFRNVAPHPQPIFDDKGKMVGAVNMLVDMTDIKRSQQALADSEAKYRELAESLETKVEEKTRQLRKSEERYHKMVDEVEDYAIILLDKHGIIQNWNKGAENIKGYKEDEIVGKSFINFYLPEDKEKGLPLQLLEQARENGKAIHEGWRMRKDGSKFWGSIVLTALHDYKGNIIGFTKVTRDLTGRKHAEDRLREYSGQLEFQNQELEQFAYAASHDMKEPLRKIAMYNSSIAADPANQLSEKSSEYLKRSITAVKRITGLIEDLLSYSKITANLESYEQVDLGEVVEEIMMNRKEDDEPKEARIEFDGLPVVSGVPFQLKQLMENLISNSVKYKHPDRDVVIRISSEVVNGSPDNSEPRPGPYHKISVCDNGVGFEQQYAEKIFDIFQRLNNLPGTPGSGIGLAICKRIAQNHKGTITASGRSNEGARFDIYLPVTQ